MVKIYKLYLYVKIDIKKLLPFTDKSL